MLFCTSVPLHVLFPLPLGLTHPIHHTHPPGPNSSRKPSLAKVATTTAHPQPRASVMNCFSILNKYLWGDAGNTNEKKSQCLLVGQNPFEPSSLLFLL